VRRFALARGVLDIPNDRSSHTTATPRGGGLAMVLAASAAFIVLAVHGMISRPLAIALLVGGGAVALIGFVDDRRPLPAGLRLAVHIVAATWAVAWLGGLPPIRAGGFVFAAGWIGAVLAVLGVVWSLNLFNFMDGIDGIAASEAAFVTGAATLLFLPAGTSGATSAAAVFCAAVVGFLPWNWPPARIFMGDVGSGYLGFVIAVLALAATVRDPVAVWVWLILGGVFFVDATVTLVRRTFRGDRLHEAHRSHAYQWVARRWGRHLPVTVAVLAINLLWLLPAAWLASHHPPWAAWIVLASFLPLVLLAALAGAGRAEPHAS
jgi:Fuc2NAc and GlcNAc transferase